MIRSFRSKALKRYFEKSDARGLQPQFVGKIKDVLFALNVACEIEELDLPTFGLHTLRGQRSGIWAIVITRNWRITFRFVDAPDGVIEAGTIVENIELEEYSGEMPGAYEVDYEDYH